MAEMTPVALGDGFALLNFLIHMPQVAQPHGGTKFIHLGICTNQFHIFRTLDAKVFQQRNLPDQVRIFCADSSAFNGMEHLGRMEADTAGVAKVHDALASTGFAKSVCRVIDHFQVMLVRNLLNGFNITYIAIDMNRHDGTGTIRDQIFDLFRIHRKIVRFHVAEDGCQTVAYDGMRR